LGDFEIIAQPVHLTRTPNRHDVDDVTAAPEYGEHTVDMLQRYGYSDEEIAKFTKDGVV
jgi:crotonobetainyl-CoA:carnitine CoA-transferase CaiB-like acyl-CoA transferase